MRCTPSTGSASAHHSRVPLRPGHSAQRLDEGEVVAVLEQLSERVPGQVLHEHAGCWTDPPPVAADSVTLLHQSAVAPWAGGLRQGADGGVEHGDLDPRPEEEIAASVVAADPEPDEGDGRTPADPAEGVAAFVTAVRDTWLRGDRDAVRSAGPVGSSRFL